MRFIVRLKLCLTMPRGSRMDQLTVALALNAKEGIDANYNLASIAHTYDKERPFRLARIWGRIASYGNHSVPVQFEAYGPESDNAWTGPVFLATPNGQRFRYSVPVTATGWYRPEAGADQVFLKVRVICTHKGTVSSGATATITCRFQLRPRENSASCPSVILPRLTLSDTTSDDVEIV